RADLRAETYAEAPAAPAGRPVYRWRRLFLRCSSSGATCKEAPNRSLRWSYRNRWLTVSYKQVAPLELESRAETRAEVCADLRAERFAEKICADAACRAVSRADPCADSGAEIGSSV